MDAVGHAEGIQDEQGHSAQQYLSRRSIRGRWRPNRSPYVCRAKWDVTADTLEGFGCVTTSAGPSAGRTADEKWFWRLPWWASQRSMPTRPYTKLERVNNEFLLDIADVVDADDTSDSSDESLADAF